MPYNLSFTAASLRPELARIVADARLRTGNWEAARASVLAGNALQARSAASGIRLERELRQRLALLTEPQLLLLAGGSSADRSAMAWLGALKQNAIILEFTRDVLREKVEALDPVLRPSDYERFMDQRATFHLELAALAESTRTKLRRVLLRMLAEAGMLVDGPALGTLQRPVVTPEAVSVITADDRRWLAGFLVSDVEIARH